MDFNAIANALIQALEGSSNATIGLLKTQRRNYFEDINNAGSKRGTLYSTSGANQRSRYDAAKYLPAVSGVQSKTQQGILGIKGDLFNTQTKIDAMKRAADQLNLINDDYFNSLLT